MGADLSCFDLDLGAGCKIAVRAGEELMRIFTRGQVRQTVKKDGTDVSEADLLANGIILEGLRGLAPGVPVLSEETVEEFAKDFPALPPDCWIVDPLDGTTNFLNRLENFFVLMTRMKNGRPFIAVAHDPVRRQSYIAQKNKGAFILKADGSMVKLWRQEPVAGQGFRQVKDTTYEDACTEEMGMDFAAITGLSRQVVEAGYGSGDHPHVQLGIAAGVYDLSICYLNNSFRSQGAGAGPWDIAPMDLILSEANCRFYNGRTGEDFSYSDSLAKMDLMVAVAPGLDLKALHKSMNKFTI